MTEKELREEFAKAGDPFDWWGFGYIGGLVGLCVLVGILSYQQYKAREVLKLLAETAVLQIELDRAKSSPCTNGDANEGTDARTYEAKK